MLHQERALLPLLSGMPKMVEPRFRLDDTVLFGHRENGSCQGKFATLQLL